MKNKSTVLSKALGISTLLGLSFLTTTAESNSNFSMGLGININKGNGGYGYYPPPMFGYGAASSSMAACAGLGGYLGGVGGGMGGPMPMPSLSHLPPLPPLIPPHMQGGGLMGGGAMGGAPYLPANGCVMYCQPMMAYGPQVPMGPVPGGPMMDGGGGYVDSGSGGGGGANIYQLSGNGTTIIDMRQKSDTAEVVWGAAIGMGMQTTNVFPFVGPRGSYTNFDFMYGQGPRPYDLQPRPHAAP